MAFDIDVAFVFVCIFSAGLNFSMGANDESMGSAYGSRALPLKWCLILGGAMELLGSVLFGTEVATTIADKLFSVKEFRADELDVLMAIVLASLVGSSVFMTVASYFGLPVSSTHSIIGAVACGAALAKGPAILNGIEFAKIVSSWVLSPLLGGVFVVILSLLTDFVILRNPLTMARNCFRGGIEEATMYQRAKIAMPFVAFVSLFVSTLFVVIKGIPVTSIPLTSLVLAVLGAAAGTAILFAIFVVPKLDRMITAEFEQVIVAAHASLKASSSTVDAWRCHGPMWKTQRLFAYLQIITAALFAFARGSNDSSHGAGPFALAYGIHNNGAQAITSKQSEVPLWTLALGGAFMCAGLWVLGRKVVQAIGDNITSISPVRGVAIETATAITVLLFSNFGIPISSTHTLVGAIFFMGLARRRGWIHALAVPPQMRMGAHLHHHHRSKKERAQLDTAEVVVLSKDASASSALSASAAELQPIKLATDSPLAAPISPSMPAVAADDSPRTQQYLVNTASPSSDGDHDLRMDRSGSLDDLDIAEPLQVAADRSTAVVASTSEASSAGMWRVVAIPSAEFTDDGSSPSGSPRLDSGSASDNEEVPLGAGVTPAAALKTVVVATGAGDSKKIGPDGGAAVPPTTHHSASLVEHADNISSSSASLPVHGGESCATDVDAGKSAEMDVNESEQRKMHWKNLVKIALSWLMTIPLSGGITCVLLALMIKT